MSMFDTVGKTADAVGRNENTLRKLDREYGQYSLNLGEFDERI